ncbi:hypothetical protein [Variovorax guangxiensis]|uniref:Type I restriction endonuclease subunit M n=1 Tax=Variovorax guangxiensis TaxID=1775474 RepID=A0A840FXX1_9BURK|nr:hypothetical protein [Variovorax guangxiensis]MBB4223927.1 hypothetical protein [Variovorax guangxiensis]
MSDDKVPVPAQDVQTLKARKPLFDLGMCVATPAVLDHLAKHAVFPVALLSRHQHGDWGNVDPADARSNDQAILSGARVISSYLVAYVVIWVITEAVGDDGRRSATTLLLPEEY